MPLDEGKSAESSSQQMFNAVCLVLAKVIDSLRSDLAFSSKPALNNVYVLTRIINIFPIRTANSLPSGANDS